MRTFVIFSLIVAGCNADKLGYNYQPVGHSDAGLSFAPGTTGSGGYGGSSLGVGGDSAYGGGSFGSGGSIAGGSFGGGSFGSGSIGGGSTGGGSYGGGDVSSIGGGSIGGGHLEGPTEFNKEFYTYSAPEEEFNDANAAQEVANSVKKGIRVIFIKGPENRGLENAALALAKQSSDDRTAIYVLNKQADIGDLANKLNSIRNDNNNKPEVHFVKYRTPEDAANAQRQIQSQYDALGGTSQSHNGGIAPVINFASQAPIRTPTGHAPKNAYLPAAVFRHRF